MEENKIQHSKPVPPFVRFCAANIPMVFDDSLSYYEALCALWNWLQTDVIDVINNNARVTEVWREELTTFENNVTDEIEGFETVMRKDFADLVDLFNQLQSWVDNYFENLDVQEEINNKLDELVEDGTLEHIIASYLQTQKIYDTHSDMIADADSLVDGLKVQTLGYSSINDGGGAFYYITDDSTDSNYKEDLGNGLYAIIITEKLYHYNALALGFNPDGETDNSAALHNFITNYSKDKLVLYIPKGEYYINKTNERNTLPDETSIIGDDAYIFFNDDEADAGVSMLSGAVKKFELKGLSFESTFATYGQTTNTAQLYYEEFDTVSSHEQIVNIEDCKFAYFRKTLMSSSRSKYVTIRNCEYKFISRDCNRFLGANYSCVENCKFYSCGDDLVSCHGNVANSQHIFAHNYCYASYGVGILGGKNIDIHDNEFVLPLNLFKCGYDGNEGGATEVLNFHDNKVTQPAHTSYSGRILGMVNAQTDRILFNNNVVKDGNATKADVVTIGDKHLDATVDKGMFLIYVADAATLNYLEMNGNYYNAPFGGSALGFGDTQLLRGNITDVAIRNNKIENFYSIVHTSPKLNWVVENNYFNADTQHLVSTDGMFANSSALRVFNQYPVNFRYNYLRNISGNYAINHTNYLYYQPDGKYMNPINLQTSCKYIPYTESTGLITNDTLDFSNGMPTGGYYHQGDFVSSIYTNPNNPIGWYRLTTGNNHVAGTDWVAIYPKTTSS